MPVYRPDPTKVSAGLAIYEKGEYLLEIGEPKPFERETKQGKNAGNINHGVMFRCVIADGPNKGKPYLHNCMMHTLESEGFSKQFQMAAYGYDKKDEAKFDEEVGSVKDWSYDPKPDNGADATCGDGWRDMKGRQIYISLDKVNGVAGANDQQKVLGLRPV